MKQLLMALAITAFAYTSAEAQQMICRPVAAKHRTAVKHKSTVQTTKQTTTTSTVTACRMVPYQVCSILPDRRSVSCYKTTDSNNQTQTGPATIYGPTGPMPGEVMKFKVRTVVIPGKSKGSYCRRNEANNATICYHPGYLVRDDSGYYSYSDGLPEAATDEVTAK